MNIVVNSRFNPFTYEQLIKPLEDYTKAYNEVEGQYANLATQTEAFRDVATQENSPEAYAMFNRYATDLEAVTDDFSRGMTLANRKQLLGLKRRYAKEITPIARADAARQEALKYRRETRARDNSAMFKVENPSLDDFLHGRTVSEDYVSGKDIIARTSAKVEALSKSLFSDPEFKLVLGGQQYQITQQNGMTPDMFYAVVNDQLNNPNISEALRTKLQGFRQIMDDELDNVADWGENARRQALSSVTTGMYAGLAKPTYNYTANGEYMSKAERDASAARWAGIQIQREAQALDREKWDETKRQNQIDRGELPYKVTDTVKYYRRGDYVWTETKQADGTWKAGDISLSPEKMAEVRTKTGWGTTHNISPIYFVADNENKAKNPHWNGGTKNSRKGNEKDYTRTVGWNGLSAANQNFIKAELESQGVDWATFSTDRITVYVNDYAAEDDGMKVVISNPSGGSSNAGL